MQKMGLQEHKLSEVRLFTDVMLHNRNHFFTMSDRLRADKILIVLPNGPNRYCMVTKIMSLSIMYLALVYS